jgi:Domain of unknown function (DUF4410)
MWRMPGMTMSMPALAGLALLAACTSSHSTNETAGAMLPRPQLVIVETFAVSPDEVQLDSGLLTHYEEMQKAKNGTPRTQQEIDAGRKVADALADKLVVEIRDIGFQARRGSSMPKDVVVGLLIVGQFVSIDEGNRSERLVIGLGAGRSDVRARVQVYEVTAAGRRPMDEIEVDAKSGLKPGMAETMGAGALTGHLLVSAAAGAGLGAASEAFGANVVADSDRAASGIAKRLSALFGEQHWTR